MNYFDFFQIPISWEIDEAALKKQFYLNCKKFHPDFYSLADEAQQQWALEQSTLNNEGYAILRDPDRRLQYFLEINGKLSPAPALPQMFLMEMMDINEALMDLEMDFHTTLWEKTLSQASAVEKKLNEEFNSTLQNIKNDGVNDEMLTLMENIFLKKKYLLRIKEKLSTFAPA